MTGLWHMDTPPNLWWYCNCFNREHLDFHEVVEHLISGGVRIVR